MGLYHFFIVSSVTSILLLLPSIVVGSLPLASHGSAGPSSDSVVMAFDKMSSMVELDQGSPTGLFSWPGVLLSKDAMKADGENDQFAATSQEEFFFGNGMAGDADNAHDMQMIKTKKPTLQQKQNEVENEERQYTGHFEYVEQKLSEDVIAQMKALISRGVRRDRVHKLVYDAQPFGVDNIQANLLKASRNRGSNTPLLDYIIESGDFTTDDWILLGAQHIRNNTLDMDPVGTNVACSSPDKNPQNDCGGVFHATCKLIQSTCQLLGNPEFHAGQELNPFKKDDGCQCCSVAFECVACASQCGWNYCASQEWTPALPKHDKCPPNAANYFGRENVLQGFYRSG